MRTCGLPRCPVQPQSRPIAISRERCALAIGAEEVSAVDLVRDVGQFVGDAVGDDDIGLALERGEIAHDARVEQPILFEQRFIDDDLYPLRLPPLHRAQYAARPEIVRPRLHREAVDTDDGRAALDELAGDEILARRVRGDDRLDQILRLLLVIGEHLLGVLGQAIAAVSEGRIVVEGADARSEEHTSELQSLMRISYAVFCLKKKKHKTHNSTINQKYNKIQEDKE